MMAAVIFEPSGIGCIFPEVVDIASDDVVLNACVPNGASIFLGIR
jgi:hypothetical protein